MIKQKPRNIAAIILAAGKGKRMQVLDKNKVTLQLAEKPLITHTVDFMYELGIKTVLVVIGYHKESVMTSLEKKDIIFVEQEEQLGTGHALMCAIKDLPTDITDVLVAYGDDAILYSKKNKDILIKLFAMHETKQNALTFLTIEQEKPFGLGRIVRNNLGKLLAIIEEKDATGQQKKITEINPGCFIFSVDFLKEFLSQLEKSPVTGEYYVTSLIDLAIKNHKKVGAIKGGKMAWRGVNTKEELREAEKLYTIE